MVWALALLGSCASKKDAAGDGGDSSSRGGSYTLCDGSDEIRLGLVSEGGAVDTTYRLTNPYGHSFLFVDGHCHYFASASWLQGVVEGDLSKERAAQLAQTLSLRRIEQLDYHDAQSCPDAGVAWLRTASGYVDCSCGCDAKTPDGVEDSLGAAGELRDQLIALGSPLAGPIVLVAILEEKIGGSDSALQEWPIIWPLSDIATTWEAYTGRPEANLRRLTGDEARSVRMLRANALALQPDAGAMRVSDQSKVYDLYLREELPDAAREAIERLVAR